MLEGASPPNSGKVAVVGPCLNVYEDNLALFDGSTKEVRFVLCQLGQKMRIAAVVQGKVLHFVSCETPLRQGRRDMVLEHSSAGKGTWPTRPRRSLMTLGHSTLPVLPFVVEGQDEYSSVGISCLSWRAAFSASLLGYQLRTIGEVSPSKPRRRGRRDQGVGRLRRLTAWWIA
jgi:hypothetical protein